MRFKENVRILVRDIAEDIQEWTSPTAPFDIGSLKIRLDAENEPLVPLPVVANLATANESAWIRIKGLRRKIPERCGVRERIEMSIGASPAVTGVATEVEAGPSVIALWRCRRDLFHFLSARQRLGAGHRG